MKKIMMQGLALMFFFTAAAAVVGSAQTVGLRVNIPFDFNVSDKVLPAGNYLILAPMGQTLRLFGPNGTAALANTNQIDAKRPSGPGEVVFNCYVERCFLSRFQTARTDRGQEVIKSDMEKKLTRQQEMVAVITLRGNRD